MAELQHVRHDAPDIVRRKHHHTVLIIEPDDLIRGLLEHWLREAGYTVIAQSLEQLPRAGLGALMPALVILDVASPRDAGKIIDLVKALCPSPILALSGRFQGKPSSSTNLARQLGVRNTLAKPFNRGDLLAAVGDSIKA